MEPKNTPTTRLGQEWVTQWCTIASHFKTAAPTQLNGELRSFVQAIKNAAGERLSASLEMLHADIDMFTRVITEKTKEGSSISFKDLLESQLYRDLVPQSPGPYHETIKAILVPQQHRNILKETHFEDPYFVKIFASLDETAVSPEVLDKMLGPFSKIPQEVLLPLLKERGEVGNDLWKQLTDGSLTLEDVQAIQKVLESKNVDAVMAYLDRYLANIESANQYKETWKQNVSDGLAQLVVRLKATSLSEEGK